MKYLNDYTNDKQTELFEECDAFFCFSRKQFNEGKKEGITYVNVGAGLVCNKIHVQKLMEGLDKIQEEGIAQDIKENGIEAIIKRELYNYECFYTGSILEAVEQLKQYKITKEQVQTIYAQELEKQNE